MNAIVVQEPIASNGMQREAIESVSGPRGAMGHGATGGNGISWEATDGDTRSNGKPTDCNERQREVTGSVTL